MSTRSININVPVLARVEGEGALDLRIEGNAIRELKLRIYEPPRYFEKFLEGRSYRDVPDTVARICGICPVAYQMSAVHALESIFQLSVTPWTRSLRRLLYCGEWIQSHSLHIHMLAAPDFLGFSSIIEMAAEHAGIVRRGLRLQGLGNDIIGLIGGRSVHPVSARVGGFYHAPDAQAVAALLDQLESAREDVVDLVKWVAALEMPDDEQDFVSVSIRHPDEYAMNEGGIISDAGLDIPIEQFEEHFEEIHQQHSTALHCLLHGQPYLVGPLARINNNLDKLPEPTRQLLDSIDIRFPSRNMFHSMLARAIELHFALNEAINIMQSYAIPDSPYIMAELQAGVGYGCTEAPRGILWHRYETNDDGHIVSARIVPPTSQNQARIEQDIENALNHYGLDHDDGALQLHAEKVIRNYDPCISCATHFLKLTVDRISQQDDASRMGNTSSSSDHQVTVLAIGSPMSPDNKAWQLIDCLQQDQSFQNQRGQDISIHKLDRPGADVLRYLQQKGKVVLLDSFESPDTYDLKILQSDELNLQTSLASSHGLGLAEALKLGMQLGHDIDNVELIGIPTAGQIDELARQLKQYLIANL